MADLALATVLIAGACVLLFEAGRRFARRASQRSVAVTATLCVVLLTGFSVLASGKLLVAQVVPLSAVIVLGNLLAPGAALLAGMAAASEHLPRPRRMLCVAALVIAATAAVCAPFVGAAPAAQRATTEDGVWLQSSDASCSAAAAATLLNLHGIEADEEEMIRLCLTTRRGTPALGLYRGLRIKTRGTGWSVRVVRGSMARVLADEEPPVLLRLRLDDPAKSRLPRWAWSPGTGHAVVLLGRAPDGQFDVADPAVGQHKMSRDQLEQHWRGEGIRLLRE